MKHLLLKVVCLGILSGCGRPSNNGQVQIQTSVPQGYFESFDPEMMQEFLGKQSPIPEFEEGQSILFSYESFNLVAYKPFDSDEKNSTPGIKLVESLIAAGVTQIYVNTPSSVDSNSEEFQGLISRLNTLLTGLPDVTITFLHDREEPGEMDEDPSVWARDWAPMTLNRNDVADSKQTFLEFNYSKERRLDDIFPFKVANFFKAPRLSLPLYEDGGNFMSDEDANCFLTDKVIVSNVDPYDETDIAFSEEEIRSYFKMFVGCKSVKIFPRMPYESTGHIDMWAKLLPNKVVLVNEIREKSLDTITNQVNLNSAKKIQKYLDDRAQEFQDLGYTVERIPMPAPERLKRTFLTYANSLIVNKNIVIPSYEKGVYKKRTEVGRVLTEYDYTDSQFFSEYEQEVKDKLEKYGYTSDFINSDYLIHLRGAIHCITMQWKI